MSLSGNNMLVLSALQQSGLLISVVCTVQLARQSHCIVIEFAHYVNASFESSPLASCTVRTVNHSDHLIHITSSV